MQHCEGSRRQLAQYGTAIIDRVPAFALPHFAAAAEADPGLRRLTGGSYTVIPPGRRSHYCLIRAWQSGASFTNEQCRSR